ncbi:hypothetical protein N7478_009301 [Penicillium angulare]|uniref:uncharacterized protein n=1 Tax=Penicillium angulare TaxID=116970 RepID=UPI002540F454|nr:uncharacterized protein N7478_009301 [Penicillium angulare]KAJ5266493.1 hypothetical protein N7478_009301 [Penicillium angulare]
MLSSSLSLGAGSLFLLWLSSPAKAGEYELFETWQGKDFFEYFNFYTGADPTNGWVNYLDQSSAESAGLVKVTEKGTVYIGVDHETTLSPSGKGRDSVRVGTHKYYGQSLVIADIAHMPGNACGSWPAFWTVGREWPQDGEIDIIEGVNMQDHNEIVMHTAGTCALTDEGMSGYVNATTCGEALGPVGCVIEGQKGSYGDSFNAQGGGVYAMEWTEQFLKIWFFPRHAIPASITSGDPNTQEFGMPMALVQEGCDVANSFKAQSFVFDVTFCGDWAGGVFGESGCPMTSSDSFASCTNFVAQNPQKFKDTYWEINSVKVYQTGVKGPSVPSSPHTSAPHETSELPFTESHTSKTHTKPAHTSSETHAVEIETHATKAVQTSPSIPTKPVEKPTQASEQIFSVENVATWPAAAHISQVASEPVPEAPIEQPSVTEHHKPAATRYVTEFVTGTISLCSSGENSSPAPPATSAAKPSIDISQAHHSIHANHNSASPKIEPPTVWQNVNQGAEEAKKQPHSEITTPSAPSTPTGIPQGFSAPSSVPSGADALHGRPSSSEIQMTRLNVPTTSAQSSAAGPGKNSDPVKPQPTGASPQTSKPIIPRPSGSSAASGSAFHSSSGAPGASGSAMGQVFTGAADRLSLKVPMLFVAFFLTLAV